MVHRAILGSIERFMAILIEHLGGKWPLWISPRQVQFIAVGEEHQEYCKKVYETLKAKGWLVELEQDSSLSLNKKIRNAQLKQFNYIVVVGSEEVSSKTINVRARNGDRIGKITLDNFENKMISEYPESFPLPI